MTPLLVDARSALDLATGTAAGAAFGVAFGALASVFNGGPDPLVGVAESWWWFAIVGAAIAFGLVRAQFYDRTRRS